MLGYRSKVDLIEQVGCSRQQLDRWMKMTEPPAKMRMGLDRKLCRVLEVDRHTLFTTWNNHDPHQLPRAGAGTEDYARYQRLGDEKTLRAMVVSLAESADYDTLIEAARVLFAGQSKRIEQSDNDKKA